MRIVIFNYSSSGLFHYAASLALHVAQQKQVEKVLFVTSRANNVAVLPQNQKLHVIALPFTHTATSLLAWLLNPFAQFQFQKLVRNFNPDTIHITDVIPIHFFHYLFFRKIPAVITIHDPVPHHGDHAQFATRLMLRFFAWSGDRFVMHGSILKQALAAQLHINLEKIAVIPIGAWPPLVSSSPSLTSTIPNSVLFFGRIVAYKGLDLLLTALLQLQAQGVLVRLILAGSGDLAPYQAQLRKLVNPVIVNRYISEEKLPDYFQQASVVVLPYKEATQSAVATMAMAAGKPIIATRVGALPELLHHNQTAVLIEPTSESLARSIQTVLNNKALQDNLSRSALRAAQTTFSWETVARQHVTLYHKLCR